MSAQASPAEQIVQVPVATLQHAGKTVPVSSHPSHSLLTLL